ncbi:MAG: hypothetical protein PHE36_13180, partial [Novosphingobium sp.]|nr:hypothetical protein [Novosphingobium sp.]
MKRDVLFGVSASSNGVASNRKVLGSGTALAALAVAMYFSPLSVNPARADCVNSTGSSPDDVVCTGSDTDGFSTSSGDNTGVNVTMDPGSFLTGGAGTSLDVELTDNNATRTFNFNMLDSTAIISGAGTQIHVSGDYSTFLGVPYDMTTVNGTWNIGGLVASSGGDAIVVDLPNGTGGTGITMNILPTGTVRAADDAIVINHQFTGRLNYTLNNQGTILAGGDGVHVDVSLLSTGAGSVTI